MATKTAQPADCVTADTTCVKTQTGPQMKIETSEEIRRRRAGIACFL